MAILKETNMWFILIVVFAYDTSVSSLRMWSKSAALISTAAVGIVWDEQTVLPHAESETFSTFAREA